MKLMNSFYAFNSLYARTYAISELHALQAHLPPIIGESKEVIVQSKYLRQVWSASEAFQSGYW